MRGGSSSSPSDNEQEEEVYVALCVCLAILERALYDIHRGGNARRGEACGITRSAGVTRATATATEECKGGVADDSVDSSSGGVGGVGGGDEDLGGEAVRPAMILRDLIATPEVKAALPEQMVTVLRLLLLPLGFNIRNLVVSGGMRGRVVGFNAALRGCVRAWCRVSSTVRGTGYAECGWFAALEIKRLREVHALIVITRTKYADFDRVHTTGLQPRATLFRPGCVRCNNKRGLGKVTVVIALEFRFSLWDVAFVHLLS